MLDLNALLAELKSLDIRLYLDGEKLRFDAPQGALTSELRTQLQSHKNAIIAHLKNDAQQEINGQKVYPFSFAQQHFWALQQLNPNDSFYTVPFAFKLIGALNIDVLKNSFNAIMQRHEILRTTLQKINDKTFQVIAPARDIDFVLYDLSDNNQRLNELIAHELQNPFNLEQDSCLRVRLFQLASHEFVLVLCLHILIYDQRSLNALLNEISLTYSAFALNETLQLPPLPLQYGDYALEQQALLNTAMNHRANYWQNWFKTGEPETWTWQTQAIKRAPEFEADILWQYFSDDLSSRLKQFAQANNVTLYMSLLSAYTVLLKRYCSCDDIIIGTTFANRGRWEFDNLIGSTLSVLSLRISLHDNPTWLDLILRIRGIVAEAMAFQDIPYRAIMPIIQPQRTKLVPLFHSILSFLAETAHKELKLANLTVEFLESVANPASRPDLYLTVWENANHEGLTGYWLPQKNIFSDNESAAVMRDFEQLLQLMVANPKQHIAEAMSNLS